MSHFRKKIRQLLILMPIERSDNIKNITNDLFLIIELKKRRF